MTSTRKMPLMRCAAAFLLSLVETSSASPLLNVVDPTDWLAQCVPPFKESGFEQSIPISNYDLIDKDSGLCADFMTCAFDRCIMDDEHLNLLNETNLETTQFADVASQLPALNLPSHITFPTSVKDVVEIVEYAGSQCMTISIKNGGHSYAGSSSQAGSIQLNLRDFPKYSETSIVECDSSDKSGPCKLAIARNKPATIHVGGGELWDHVYRAVLNYKDDQGAQKYDVVGGGAGSVSSIGGWLQGGGESIGDERMYGFGVDNVLELEMVLADGSHVKFGPTEWEDSEGMIYPKTTKVEGSCNQNVQVDESEWVWEPCDLPFQDLWFAVRGGGGGTYGVVTGAHYQLHPHKPLHVMTINRQVAATLAAQCTEQGNCVPGDVAITFFLVDLYFNPSNIGLDEETSNSCGSPGMVFDLSRFANFFCRSPETVMEAWSNYVQALPAQLDGLKETLPSFFVTVNGGSYPQLALSDGERAPAGRIEDNPPPSTFTDTITCWSALVPMEFLQNQTEDLYSLLRFFPSSHVIGGNTNVAHDQMTAIPPLQREAGLQTCIYSVEMQEMARGLFLPFWQKSEDVFPGGTEYNHISNILSGPRKEDWTKPCGFEDSETDECVSLVESVWGTELLAELETIKLKVDPHNMFKCYRCVGFDNDSGDCVPTATNGGGTNTSTTTPPSPETSAANHAVNIVWATIFVVATWIAL